ncbi:Serine/threonine-protein kinase MRCK beta [Chytridiales sp. JEL 0842]|nr:Serine/threonine-protein kinase MRCK beta [Chytridiales sp. JEL 0842]
MTIYAMKILKKTDLLTRREAAFFMEERNALVFSQDSRWITTLYAAFQDEENLYLVMDGMPEDQARFYIAEILMALEELHGYHYIHRDLKPENCLITSSGHLKLADFGSCIRLTDSSTITSHETVGTPDYICPEILRAHEGNVRYGKEVDMWSLGVILYELLYEEVPFYAESLSGTYAKIMDYENNLQFLEEYNVSDEAKDLISKLICKPENRLGRDSIDSIKSHPWFKGFDWSKVGSATPPFVPELNGPADTRYFENEDNESKKVARKPLPRTKEFAGQNLPFVGYTYIQNAMPSLVYPFSLSSLRKGGSLLQLKSFSGNLDDADSAVARQFELERQRDAQKLQDLQARFQALETEIGQEAQNRAELQSQLVKIEAEKAKLEADVRKLQKCVERDLGEKEELQSRLGAMKRKLDVESSRSSRLDAVEAERDSLAKELHELKSEGAKQRISVTIREEEIADVQKAKLALEKEVEALNARLSEEAAHKLEQENRLEAFSKKAEKDASRISELEYERAQLEAKYENASKDVYSLRKSLSSEVEKSDKLAISNMELERIKAVMEIDLQALKRQLDEAVSERQLLMADKQRSSSSDADLAHLKAQVEALSAQKAKDATDLADMSKQKAMLDIELADLKEKLRTESRLRAEAQALHEDAVAKLAQSTSKCSTIDEQRSKVNSQLKAAESTICSLRTEIAELKNLDSRILSLEKENAALLIDLESARAQVSSHNATQEIYEAKIADYEKMVQEERALKRAMEVELISERSTLEETQNELTLAKSRLNFLRDEQVKFEASRAEEDAKLRAEKVELLEQLQAGQRQREALDNTVEKLRDSLRQMEEKPLQDTDSVGKHFADLQAHIQELETHRSLEIARSSSLQDRIEELELQCSQLQEQLDDTRGQLTRSLDSLKPDNKSVTSETKSEKTRVKLRNVFFRTQQQRQDQEKAMQKIHELEEDLKKTPETGSVKRHSRNLSLASVSTHLSSQTKQSEYSTTLMEFDVNTELRGTLKVPKSNKVKKGWISKIAVVRDFKLYVCDREKEADCEDGALVVDLRADMFVAKRVTQNELIHVSSRDIDNIFKIQFVGVSEGSKAAHLSPSDISKEIVKLQNQIENEEKMRSSLEGLFHIATFDNQRQEIVHKLEASNDKIKNLQLELDSLLEQLNAQSAKGEDSSSNSSVPNFEELSTELFNEEVNRAKNDLQMQIDEKKRQYDIRARQIALHQKEKTYGQGKKVIKGYEAELSSLEKSMNELQGVLTMLNSDQKSLVAATLGRIGSIKAGGHDYQVRQYHQPISCTNCHETIIGYKLLECSHCGVVCHSDCRKLIKQTCADIIKLKDAPAMYFMADSEQERNWWIQGLEFFHKEARKIGNPSINPSQSPSPSPYNTAAQPHYTLARSPSVSSSTSSHLSSNGRPSTQMGPPGLPASSISASPKKRFSGNFSSTLSFMMRPPRSPAAESLPPPSLSPLSDSVSNNDFQNFGSQSPSK